MTLRVRRRLHMLSIPFTAECVATSGVEHGHRRRLPTAATPAKPRATPSAFLVHSRRLPRLLLLGCSRLGRLLFRSTMRHGWPAVAAGLHGCSWRSNRHAHHATIRETCVPFSPCNLPSCQSHSSFFCVMHMYCSVLVMHYVMQQTIHYVNFQKPRHASKYLLS